MFLQNFADLIARAFGENSRQFCDLEIVSLDSVNTFVRAEAIASSDKKACHVILIDLSERRKLEVTLHEAKLIAEKANTAKSNFLAYISHEIRGPLNSIVASASVLLQEQPTPKQQQLLHYIDESGEEILRIIRDLTDLARIETGNLVLQNSDFQIIALAENVLSALSDSAHHKNLELRYNIAAGVPAQLIGDVGRLGQVLRNLIGNSIKFTTTGAVTLAIDSQSIRDDLVRLHFIVQDYGIGISEKDMSRLFMPYAQVGESLVRKNSGTGLGLMISKALVTAMGGEIGVESKVGEGSSFWFTVICKRSRAA